MKDYLKDSLSDEEERYIYGIINKTILKYFRKTNKLEKERFSRMEWANDSVEKKNEENETGVKHETGQKLCGTISYRAGI